MDLPQFTSWSTSHHGQLRSGNKTAESLWFVETRDAAAEGTGAATNQVTVSWVQNHDILQDLHLPQCVGPTDTASAPGP